MSAFENIISKGQLELLYNNSEINEIFVNAPNQIYVQQKGKLQKVNSQFKDIKEVWAAIDDFLQKFGHKINADVPLLETRLPDGSWLNLLLPPAVVCGPVLTIRKARKDRLTIQELIRFGCISSTAADFLKACVKAGLNILVSGGPDSGKTTVLNVLASFIPDDSERIIVIELSDGLALHQQHVVTLSATPDILAGKEGLTKTDLIINSLNMMADRIIVSELEGREVIPLLQAMTTGSEGIMTSVFAVNPADALTRLEFLMTQANSSIPLTTTRQMIADGFDMIVQINRLRDGSRKVMKITEVTGMEGEAIVLSDIFEYQETSFEDGRISGRTKATGHIPRFLSRLVAEGVHDPLDFFD